MTRLILTSLALALSILPSYGQDTLTTGRSGYTTGTVGGAIQNTYTDRYGNTTGWVGGKNISTYSDGYGGTTGTIGNKRVNTYEDGYGRTTGTIGRAQVDIYSDPSGHTTGTIGRRRLNCGSGAPPPKKFQGAIVPQCSSGKAPSAPAGAAQQVTSHCASDDLRTCHLQVD